MRIMPRKKVGNIVASFHKMMAKLEKACEQATLDILKNDEKKQKLVEANTRLHQEIVLGAKVISNLRTLVGEENVQNPNQRTHSDP